MVNFHFDCPFQFATASNVKGFWDIKKQAAAKAWPNNEKNVFLSQLTIKKEFQHHWSKTVVVLKYLVFVSFSLTFKIISTVCLEKKNVKFN